jgi:hypothetical protein
MLLLAVLALGLLKVLVLVGFFLLPSKVPSTLRTLPSLLELYTQLIRSAVRKPAIPKQLVPVPIKVSVGCWLHVSGTHMHMHKNTFPTTNQPPHPTTR